MQRRSLRFNDLNAALLFENLEIAVMLAIVAAYMEIGRCTRGAVCLDGR